MDSSSEQQLSSGSLMLAYANGDSEAFNELYSLHKAPLFRFVLRQVQGQGIAKAKADELFQDIWLKVINARHKYQATARFETWLYTIARNCIIDEFRRNGKFETTEFDEENSEDFRQVEANDCDKKHQQDQLLSSVESLPFEQRQAFLLKYEAGMTSNDIAHITGTNQETAKSRVRYAIKQLKAKLGGSQ